MDKQQAWKYYKTWMHEKTFCKALNVEVKVTRKGWEHIVSGSRSRRRTVKDRYNKFQLLRLAKNVIKTVDDYSLVKERNTHYYVLEANYKKYGVRVLLKKASDGTLYFFSVMRHKKK